MARFEPTDAEHKEALKARAEKLKPNAFNLVATARGWEQSRPNGTLELLVSFAGLDELLGDNAPKGEDAPVELVITPEPAADAPVVEEAPKKKGGRPKKEVAVDPTPVADVATPVVETPVETPVVEAPVVDAPAVEEKAAE